MRHPFVTAGRRMKPPSSSTKSASSLSSLGRNKQVTDTPKKSLISAPTPLTARLSRTTTNGGPTTPSNTQSQPIASGSSHTSRSYRSSQSQSLSNFSSSRTLSGYAVSDSILPWISAHLFNVSSLVQLNDYIFILGLIKYPWSVWPAAVYHSSSSCHVCSVHLHCFP